MKYLGKSTKMVVKLDSQGSIEYDETKIQTNNNSKENVNLVTPTIKNVDFKTMFAELEKTKKEKRDKEKEEGRRKSFIIIEPVKLSN